MFDDDDTDDNDDDDDDDGNGNGDDDDVDDNINGDVVVGGWTFSYGLAGWCMTRWMGPVQTDPKPEPLSFTRDQIYLE